MDAFVSVIIPSFNSAAFISRCLRSLERQTYTSFEVIIVDAGSKDRTREIASGFDHRFRWLDLPMSDMGMARNHGIASSTSRYVMFLDSDDCYLENKIERQVAYLEANPSCDVVFCSVWHYRTGRENLVGQKPATELSLLSFLKGQNENLNSMCMRRSLWEAGYKFGEGDRGRYGEEWRLQLSMAAGGVRMHKTHDPLVLVELRPDSHTSWSRQWIMKQQALDEVGRVYETLTSSQREGIDIETIKDNFRLKLVPALLIENKRTQAAEVVRAMTSNRLRRRAALLLQLASFMPGNFLEKVLPRLWLWRQNRSFCWENVGKNLRQELDEIAACQSTTKL